MTILQIAKQNRRRSTSPIIGSSPPLRKIQRRHHWIILSCSGTYFYTGCPLLRLQHLRLYMCQSTKASVELLGAGGMA
jgi:hypothetical protein